MINRWPVLPLGKVIRHRKEFVQIDDVEDYKRCRVQLHARGILLRDVVSGAEIKTKSQQVCRAGEFLVAEIDAKVGGYGIVPKDLEGAIVSSHYFLFEIDERRLDRCFLGYFIRTPDFRDQVGARGSTNYAAIRPHHVLKYRIPLPPLSDQRRIVAKIEQLTAKIEEAQGLHIQSSAESDALAFACSSRFFDPEQAEAPLARLDCLTERITKGESPSWQGFSYQEDGPTFVRSENVLWGSLHVGGAKHISDAFHRKLSRSQLRPGDVLINLVGASIGRACVVPPSIGEANVNQAVGVVTPRAGVLDSEYLMRFMISPYGQRVIHGGKVETARPNISLRDVSRLSIPVTTLPEQRRIIDYLDGLQAKVDRLKDLQAKTAAELDALLPSILDQAFKGQL